MALLLASDADFVAESSAKPSIVHFAILPETSQCPLPDLGRYTHVSGMTPAEIAHMLRYWRGLIGSSTLFRKAIKNAKMVGGIEARESFRSQQNVLVLRSLRKSESESESAFARMLPTAPVFEFTVEGEGHQLFNLHVERHWGSLRITMIAIIIAWSYSREGHEGATRVGFYCD